MAPTVVAAAIYSKASAEMSGEAKDVAKGKALNISSGKGARRVGMLNEEKIKLMHKLAYYEKSEKRDFKLSRYYKNDYVRVNLLKSVASVTVGYLLILLLLGLYKSEYLIANAVNLAYKDIGMTILGVYVLILTVYVTGSLVGYSLYYNYSRKKLARYFNMLKKVKKISREEENFTVGTNEEYEYEEDGTT